MVNEPSLDSKNVHSVADGKWLLVGACGAGMRAFAEMLLEAGQAVVGTDEDQSSLSNLRFSSDRRIATISWDCDSKWDIHRPTVVVHSLAVLPATDILQQARRQGIPVMALPQALGEFLRDSRQTCVAGTHGKTTTAGMIWWILNRARLAPAGFIGGEFCGIGKAGSFGAGVAAVVESCEYREAFLSLSPQTLVLTGVEPDHFDCFESHSQADQAFRKFVGKLPSHGTLVVNAANYRAVEIGATAQGHVVTYGTSDSGDWRVRRLASCSLDSTNDGSLSSFRQAFEIIGPESSSVSVEIQVPGAHNLENALAAIVAATMEGISAEQAAEHLASFPGMRRRFEYRGNWKGIDLIDDYAHHPTAIKATLKTARDIFPGRRVFAVFEPHQVSRTENLFPEFVNALAIADECLILPVLPARETVSLATCRRLSGQMVRRISEAGGRAFLIANLDQVLGRLDHAARPGDVVITMGAGRTNQIHDEIHRRLQRDSAA